MFIVIIFSEKAGFSEEVNAAFVGGIIGALGAIFGGLITYYGVLITIKNQRIDTFLDKYPERIMAGERLNAFLIDFESSIDKCFNYGSMGVYVEDFESLNETISNILLKNIDKYKIDAASISRLAFRSIKNIEYCLKLYGAKFHNDIIRGIEREGIDWDINSFESWKNQFKEDIDIIKNEISIVDKEFEQYTKIDKD